VAALAGLPAAEEVTVEREVIVGSLIIDLLVKDFFSFFIILKL
jgi:hypothetical protein